MIELVVLDTAGTTVEEYSAVYVALEEAVRAAGGSPTKADIQRWMGGDKREAIAGMASDQSTVDGALADFGSRLAAAYAARPPHLLPGVGGALAKLRADGIKIALTTGFDRGITDSLPAVVGVDDSVVDAVVCVDDVAAGRPAPYMVFRAMELTGARDVRRVLTAGDTVRDLEAGTNAGAAMVVGVLSGGLDATSLGAVRHTHLLPSVADLPALLG
ncbi:phosphonatase-like hydrolase [Actinokineospora xionganensis]|uniref:Phosphonatase-like hydrolase n=1 Tax=Actinokineospora xionganensis TaxID=2684470 RepID=A0ABR7KZ27_9PSEU|nr:phosphonatase-like hydrolase [Actinokineospora xionganensis]MBC6445620.1 phosphonatase-like hydrolase [Actinokineospora xionganensis]